MLMQEGGNACLKSVLLLSAGGQARMISFIIGLFVGSFFGVAPVALLAMARDPEPPKEDNPNPNYKPPTGKNQPTEEMKK